MYVQVVTPKTSRSSAVDSVNTSFSSRSGSLKECMEGKRSGENLKVHKIENFFGSDFEFCVISLLVMLKY
jgi:hypothetical protein